MFYSTKVGGGRSGGLHGYDLFAPKLPVLSSPQEFFSRSERCGEAQCVAFFRAPRLFPFSSFSHSNIVFFFYSTHYPTGPQIFFPSLIIVLIYKCARSQLRKRQKKKKKKKKTEEEEEEEEGTEKNEESVCVCDGRTILFCPVY